MRDLPDGSVDLVLCDLPYGTTQNKWDSVLPLDALWEEYSRLCRGAVVLTASQPFTTTLISSNLANFRYNWVWHKSLKTNFLNAKRQPLREHEDICVFSTGKSTYNPQGLRKGSISGGNRGTGNYGKWDANKNAQQQTGYPASVLSFPNGNAGNIHPTQKPVTLFEYLVRTYTNPGNTVLDNTAGSGTTAIAAENADRRWICIERDPDYAAKAIARIREHVGEPDTDDFDGLIGYNGGPAIDDFEALL